MKIAPIAIALTFTFAVQSQSNLNAEKIANEACDCIGQINTAEKHKNDAISNCIAKAISVDKTKSKTVEIDGATFHKIESYLVAHCTALNNLAFTENEGFEHATSKNVLAQLAYDDGMEYMQEKNYEGAIKRFTKAVTLDPNFAFAWDNLGVSYRKLNQFDKAIASYKKSLAINPEGRMPLMNIALTYNLNKDKASAAKYYQQFIDVYPEDPEGYYGIGLIQYTSSQQEIGLDNMVKAYTMYTKQNSPYRTDAAKKIGFMYNDLKSQGKLEVFNKIAQKHNLKINTQ